MKSILKKIVVSIITWQARLILKKYKPEIVAITGSVGKTSSKDAIYTVMRTAFKVRKSDKSFNSEIGMPLTILGCHNAWSDGFQWMKNIMHGFSYILFTKDYPKWLVLEVGADRPGDIEKVTKWLKPNVSVITRFGKVPVHVEYFDSPAQVIREKTFLAKALKSEGTLVLNYDDEDVLAVGEHMKAKQLTYGFDHRADIVASNYSIVYDKEGENEWPAGIAFKVDYDGSSVPITLSGVVGRSHLYPALAAIAVGISQNLNLVSIATALSTHVGAPGRMKLIEGVKGTWIIDDTYNSSPVAVHEALETLQLLQKRRYKIAVLGDMLEIGKYSVEEHKKVGTMVAAVADILITVGLRGKHIAEAAQDAGMSEKNIFQYDTSPEAGKFLESILEQGDLILVKGSQGVRMEKVVEEIMANPGQKRSLLVRQDLEWQKR